MGAVFARREIHDAMMAGPENAIELFHGYTYSGHPAACAAGLATLEIYRREGLLTRGAELAPAWEAAVHALADCPHVIDIRNLGMMAAIELSPRPDAPGKRGYEAMVAALAAGAMVRFTGDTLAFSPPLIITEDEIGTLFAIVRSVLETLA
jgi:beta-alanine--pyruvate transaminase